MFLRGAARRHNPEDQYRRSQSRENLTSYCLFLFFRLYLTKKLSGKVPLGMALPLHGIRGF